MKVKEIIDKLKGMEGDGDVIPNPDIAEGTGCEDIQLVVLDRDAAAIYLTKCKKTFLQRDPEVLTKKALFKRY